MDLKHVYELCKELKSITSTKEKHKFLINNRCEDLDELLKFLLDPSITTGIDKKKLTKKLNFDDPYPYEPFANTYRDLGDMLNYLKENNTGTDIDIYYCQKFIDCHCFLFGMNNTDLMYFLMDVFTKRLKLGVNIKTVNKSYDKDFIHVHEVQLGSSRDKLHLKNGEWFSLSQKMNGIRCTYVNGKMISRQGKEINGLEHISSILDFINEEQGNIVYDGELIRKNVDSLSDNENFRLTTSIVNGDSDKSEIEFVLFDALNVKDFYAGKSTTNYISRRAYLESVIDGFSNIRLVPIVYQGTDQSEIEKQLSLADAKGYEGLMLNKNAPYECKRTTNLIKIKTFKHSDLRIVDCIEGEGRNTGKLGAFVVEYKNNTVNVGSGFSDEQREQYWADRENLIGKICQIKYKEVSKDKNTGLESLQFPVFEMLRFDKEETSYE